MKRQHATVFNTGAKRGRGLAFASHLPALVVPEAALGDLRRRVEPGLSPAPGFRIDCAH